MSASPKSEPPSGRRGMRTLINVVLSLTVIGAGLAAANYLQQTAPRAKKRPPVEAAPWVRTMTVAPGDETVTVSAMGTVMPARELMVRPRVGGEVVAVHPEFRPGGLLAAGARLVRIDPEDYRLRLAGAERAVADARYELALEMGRQAVAAREWELLGEGRPADSREADLALRRPHLEKARAALAAAAADLARARRDLAHTDVPVPFNAVVRSKDTALGAQVSAGERLGVLVGTDRFWVRVALPVDRLRWIRIPGHAGESGSPVTVISRSDGPRGGRVVRLMGELTPEGRMAQVLVTVDDPLGLAGAGTPLLIGDFVEVRIQGRTLSGVYRVPRSALRDGDRIWIADDADRLRIREVSPVWRGPDSVLLDAGLAPGERLVVSDLASPVNGMTVRSETGTVPEAPAASGGKG